MKVVQLFDDFFSKSSKTSQKAHQQGLEYALEEYVHNIQVSSDKIEAVYHSQRKRETTSSLLGVFLYHWVSFTQQIITTLIDKHNEELI